MTDLHEEDSYPMGIAIRLSRLRGRGLPALVAILVIVVPPLVAGAGTLAVRTATLDLGAPPPFVQELPAPPVHDPARRTAVVVASNYGTEITDFLPPYEILARSGAFNVYVVAPERRLTPVTSARQQPTGLEIIPHYSYADYDQVVG